MQSYLNRFFLASILGTLGALFFLIIGVLVLSQQQNFFIEEFVLLNLNAHFISLVFLGWGHLIVNAFVIISLCWLGLFKKLSWSYFTLLVGSIWVFIFDFIATRFYLAVLPTPLFTAFFIFTSLWLSRSLYYKPKFTLFKNLCLSSKIGFLAMGYLFLFAFIAMISAMFQLFFPLPMNFSEAYNPIALSILHVGWANISGLAIMNMLLYKMEENITGNLISKFITSLSVATIIILFASTRISTHLIKYLYLPMILLLLSVILRFFRRSS